MIAGMAITAADPSGVWGLIKEGMAGGWALLEEINSALADPKIKARFADLGAVPFVATPGQMVTFVAAETEKWGKAVKFSGAAVD